MRTPTDANAVAGGGAPGDGRAAVLDQRVASLPPSRHVLAVVAHPDDEPFGLGAVLSALASAGSRLSLLCLTRGEASKLNGIGRAPTPTAVAMRPAI